MDVVWSVLALLLMLLGIIGSFLPVLPGPPMAYAGMLVMQLRELPPFSARFLIIWLVIVVVVSVLDYVMPLVMTKNSGGSKCSVWGCSIGLLIGLWFGLPGIILGPFIGAFAGELLARRDVDDALRAAVGSFIGFVFSTLLKFISCLVMGWYVVMELF